MQTANLKISVIIPVYNTEAYLRECLDSIINQTIKELEIICINDGSSDNSLKILEEYKEKDDRIIILTQQNQGAGAARNLGLKSASADYIYFIDSDDYISPDYLETMYNKAFETDADIVFNDNMESFNENKRFKQVIKTKFKEGLYDINPQFIEMRFENPVVWSKLYKKSSVIKAGAMFPCGLTSEDAYFYYTLLPFLKTAAQVNNGCYYYRERQGSLTHQTVKKYGVDAVKIFELVYLFYKRHNLLTDYKLPYRLIAYRSSQAGEYSSYRKEVLNTVNKLNLDIAEMKTDKKLKLLLISPNIFTYYLNKQLFLLLKKTIGG